jgi:hypothetical protein
MRRRFAFFNRVSTVARLHGDDTTVPLPARGGTKTERLWTYVRNNKTAYDISPVALEAVTRTDAIFDIEREINGVEADSLVAVRQARPRPLVEGLRTLLLEERANLETQPRRKGHRPSGIAQRRAVGRLHRVPRWIITNLIGRHHSFQLLACSQSARVRLNVKATCFWFSVKTVCCECLGTVVACRSKPGLSACMPKPVSGSLMDFIFQSPLRGMRAAQHIISANYLDQR